MKNAPVALAQSDRGDSKMAMNSYEVALLREKCQKLAHKYLMEEVGDLAIWLEGIVKQTREEEGPDKVITISRNSRTAPKDGEENFYSFASIQFEISVGGEII
jgi:hypothetical protein